MDNQVSVIIALYNNDNYVEEGGRSCLKQKEVGQVIVIDDGSIDNSVKVVKGIFDLRLELIQTVENMGVGHARNLGLKRVKCEYFTFLDSDDHYLGDRFVAPLKLLINNSELDGSYEAAKNYFQEGYENFRTDVDDVIEIPGIIHSDVLFDYLIRDNMPFFAITSLLLRSSKALNFSFDINFRQTGDIDYIYAIGKKLKLEKAIQYEVKIMRRLHPASITAKGKEEAKDMRLKLLKKWLFKIQKEDFASRHVRWFIYRGICAEFIQLTDNRNIFIKLFLKSALYARYLLLNPVLIRKII